MNKCLMYRIKIHHTLLNGFLTTSKHLFVIFHLMVLKWLLLLLEILLPFKKCSKEFLNNLLLCLEEKHFCIGTPAKVWTKWSSPKLSPIWMIWFLNTNSIKKLPLMTKMTKMKMMKMMKKWLEVIIFIKYSFNICLVFY